MGLSDCVEAENEVFWCWASWTTLATLLILLGCKGGFCSLLATQCWPILREKQIRGCCWVSPQTFVTKLSWKGWIMSFKYFIWVAAFPLGLESFESGPQTDWNAWKFVFCLVWHSLFLSVFLLCLVLVLYFLPCYVEVRLKVLSRFLLPFEKTVLWSFLSFSAFFIC